MLREGITSQDLADATGYSLAAVSAWRRGARVPSVGAIALLAEATSLLPERLRKMLLTRR